MSDRWACEAPEHEGSRTQVHPHDRFTRRQTFYRADGRERMRERSKDHICRDCIRREVEAEEQLQGQGSLI